MNWKITSTAFENGERIPARYTCEGENLSPPINLGDIPEGTVELALICHDIDAPRQGGWTHWVLYGLPPDVTELPEGIPADETVDDPPCRQGNNTFPTIGYSGPCPPPGHGDHRYQFTAYALREKLTFNEPPDRDALLAAMEGKIIAQAMLEGTYSR
ncbi:MAG: YbhB/YbcL family Raf kinase inhibitor-like protein [Armatimonadetes bacterium]|nr:YbhB/YbcL family Raf kinase inhibitor-like protein [Armatimonadota bacterium]